MKVRVLEDENGMYLTPRNTLSPKFIDARLFKSSTVINKRIAALKPKIPSLRVVSKEITPQVEVPFDKAYLIQNDGKFKMILKYEGYRDVNDSTSGFCGYASKKVFKSLPTIYQIFDKEPILFTTEPEMITYCFLEQALAEYYMKSGKLDEWRKVYLTAKDIDDNFDAMMKAFNNREFTVCGVG